MAGRRGKSAGCASGTARPGWIQIQQPPMTAPDQTPDTDQDVQELTDENLEEASGGTPFPRLTSSYADFLSNAGGQGGDGSAGGAGGAG
jgi:hypothetical protein